MHVIIKIKLSVCLLKSSSWPRLVLSLVTHHILGNVADLIKQSFNSPTGPDRRVYYACFSPTTEKYPQPEKFSAYTLSISLSWKLQRLSPNTTLLRLQWMNLKHTQEFLCFIFSLKGGKKISQKKKQNERPILMALIQKLNSEIHPCCLLRHRQCPSVCNAPRIGNMTNSCSRQ